MSREKRAEVWESELLLQTKQESSVKCGEEKFCKVKGWKVTPTLPYFVHIIISMRGTKDTLLTKCKYFMIKAALK